MRQTKLLSGMLVALVLGLTILSTKLRAEEQACDDSQLEDILFARIMESGGSTLKPVHVKVRVTREYDDYDGMSKELEHLSENMRPIIQIDDIRQFDDVHGIVDEYREIKAGAFIVVDSEFMANGSPKYNAIFTFFRDAEITKDMNLIFDPYLDTIDKGPIFVQLAPGQNAINLAYRIEAAAALMRVPRLMISKRFTKYQGSLATRTDQSEERDPIVFRCIMSYFSPTD